MHNPPHPGEVLLELYLKPFGLTITEAAKGLGVSRTALSQVVNGHVRISLDMAKRLSSGLHTTVDIWLDMQRDFDLWQVRGRHARLKVKPLVPKRAVGA